MKIDDYQQLAVQTVVYPRSEAIVYPALGLASEAGEAAGVVKKILRDSGCILSGQHIEKMKKELGDVLWYIAALARDVGLTMSEVAEANLAKLKSRQERGTLRGDGDDR